MRVGALLAEPFAIHRVEGVDRRREAARLLDLVGLPAGFAGRYPHELSGGQARRVGVARALALSPRLVIADEPTAGLDVSVQGGVLNLLARLQDELGLAYLLITHNLAVVRHVAHTVAVMYMGRLVERGATAAVMARPAHPYTAALLAAQPAPDPLRRQGFAGLEGEVPSLRHRPSGCEFRTRCLRAEARCAAEAPVLREVAPGREARCHFPLG
jgi:peptide/nickel transport system ATP-binding protein